MLNYLMIIPALGISLLSFGQLETLTPKEQAYKDSIAKLNQQNAAVAASQEAYNRGVTQFSGKNYTAAIAEFQKSIASDPNFTAAYYNKGLTENEAGKYTDALATLNALITKDPSYSKAYFQRGRGLPGSERLFQSGKGLREIHPDRPEKPESVLQLRDSAFHAERLQRCDQIFHQNDRA